jgi:hypothetical protein
MKDVIYITPPAAPVQAIGYEEQTAIREGHRNASEDAYFAARPAHNNYISRVIFRHGFDRGYDTTPPAQEIVCSTGLCHYKAQRPWVGLTDEQKHEIELKAGITEDDDGYIVSQVFKLIEAKLKEKNT